MKKTVTVASLLTCSLVLTSAAFAENGARQDDSNLLVWAFLGACALIVFLQLVPVITMAFGLIKGASSQEEVELEPAASKYQ